MHITAPLTPTTLAEVLMAAALLAFSASSLAQPAQPSKPGSGPMTGTAAAAPAPAAATPPAAAASAADTVEPAATEALKKMSHYLQSLKTFKVQARTTTDQVLVNGQKIELGSSSTLWVRRPDKLRADTVSDRRTRQFYFDGKTVTVFGSKLGYYAKVASPGTLKDLHAKLTEEYGLDLPLSDLFTFGTDPQQLAALSGATAIGLATIRGVACDQYAFRQEGLDWQVWIQRGDKPLPRRLVLVTTTDSSQPQHSIDLDWSPDDKPADALFVFTPPKGAHEIPMQRLDGNTAQQATKATK